MTREEAIAILQKIKPTPCRADGKSTTHTLVIIALDMAIKALEQKWIPVSEKLPEEDGCYLVTTTGTNNDIIDIAYYTEDIWHKASRIKAWMPLPEPYKAESNLDGDPVDIDKAVEHYEKTLETLKGIGLEDEL